MLARIEWYGSPTITPEKPLFCDQRSQTSPAWCAWLNMDCAMSPASCGASNASSWTSERYTSQPEKLAYWAWPAGA